MEFWDGVPLAARVETVPGLEFPRRFHGMELLKSGAASSVV